MRLQRDETSTNHPAPEQLRVGELKINSKTGILYSKLVDGSVVFWQGQKLCFDPTPLITFSYNNQNTLNINNFCCAGDNIIISVENLKLDPFVYNFSFVELTQNSSTNLISISEPQYSTYETSINNNSITLRKAIVPINFSLNTSNYNNISIFKFIVSDSANQILVEQLLTVKCTEAE